MREKVRALWWKITNPIRSNGVLKRSQAKKTKKYNIKRVFAWIGAITVSISLVTIAAVFLNTKNDTGTYAAGSGIPPNSVTIDWRMDSCTNYNPLYAHLAIGCNGFSGTVTGARDTTNQSLIDEIVGKPMSFTCSSSGVPSPTAGAVLTGTLTLTNIDMINQKVTYCGSISRGASNEQTIDGCITLDWIFVQPVNESVAIKKDAGEIFEDTLKFIEADVQGKELPNGPWSKGLAGSAKFNINLHGPFYDYLSRSPAWNGSCSEYSIKYFCSSNTVAPPAMTGKEVVLIGDSAANTAYNSWTQTQKNFFDRAILANTKSWANVGTDINSSVTSNTAFLALALGKSNLPTASSTGVVTINQWTTWITNAINTAKAKNSSIKIGIMGMYDVSSYVNGDIMYPGGAGYKYNIQQSIINFTKAVDDIARSDTNVFKINWVLGPMGGAGVPTPAFNANTHRDPCTSNGYLPSTTGSCNAGGLSGTGTNVFYQLLEDALSNKTTEAPNPTVDAARKGWGTFDGSGSFPTDRLKSTQSITVDRPDGSSAGFNHRVNFPGSNTYPAGIYYFVSKIRKNQSPNDWVLLEEWDSPYGGSNEQHENNNLEQWISYINYGTISSASTNYIDSEGKNLDRTDYFTDTISIFPYRAKIGSKEGAGDKVSRYDDANKLATSNWPQYPNGNYYAVNVCVTAYGPYQIPQAQKLQNTNLSGEPRPDNPTICKDMSPGINNGVTDFTYTNIGGWESGYYYFVTSIDKGNQSPQIAICMEDDLWTSRFNPQAENEWIWRKFQPFITSNVYNSTRNDWQPWVDVKEGNATGEDIIDRVVARGSRTLAGAQNGFQWKSRGTENDPNGDDNGERYWPKYDSTAGTNAGKYVPVLYKFYICGPFQYPQNEGTTPDMKNPTAANTTNEYQNAYSGSGTNVACNGNNTLKTIAKYITPNSCSRNPVIKNANGTYQSPTDSGNAMVEYPEGYIENKAMTRNNTCEINFGRTDENGTYYQPGYYYFTSEMIKEEQTTYASSSYNPGLASPTPVKNFILSDWHSMFNPLFTQTFWPRNTLNEIEWAYVQPQPIARSYMGATKDDRSINENQWTTRLSYQYIADRINQYKGLQLNCNEHWNMPTWSDMNNDEDFWDKVPPANLTCENVSDRVYLGFTTTKDVNYSNTIVKDENEDENNWPETNDIGSGENGSNYEVIKYRVKLYGPFATAGVLTGDTLQTIPNGLNETGKTVTVVPSTNPSVQGFVNSKSQPVAQTCLYAAKYGPNYNDIPLYDVINPTNSANGYYYQEEKTSIGQKGYYRAVFTREHEINCADDGSGVLGMRDERDVPYTTLTLSPGVYVSNVEIWKVDMNENNLYDAGDSDYGGSNLPKEEEYFSDNGTENGGGMNVDQQTVNSADKRGQITKGDVRDLMANDFHSKWADPYETIFVPPDTDIWTLRGNSDNFIVNWGSRYHDQYWAAGWSSWRDRYKDIFGNSLPDHNGDESSYKGEKDYFAPDRDPDERVGKLKVDLFGAFETRPTEAECPADKRIATWLVDAQDTDKAGEGTRLENMLPSTGDGWYVYVFSYDGDDRIPKLKTKCSDPDEQFHLGEFKPELETQIVLESADGKAPTVVSDTVKVTGYVEKDSLIRLTLFRRGGNVHNPNADSLICSVQFKIPETVDSATYSVSSYMDKNGYVFVSNTPDDIESDTNRCFAEEAGHYYWYEEFYNPDGKEIQPPNADGPYEWADIERSPPEVTTSADVSVQVGEPFHDTAYVKLPDGDKSTYHLYMRAYGPTDGAPICDTVGKSNLLFESGPHEVKKSGSFQSAYTSSLTPGIVYWIETLIDPDTGEVVAEGYCGKENEMTRVADTPAPGSEWEWTPGAPTAGEIAISATKIIATTGLLGIGAWQLLDKNSWLMRKIINK